MRFIRLSGHDFPAGAAGTDYMYIAANAGAGVADHWNNSTDKKYTKNLNPNAMESN